MGVKFMEKLKVDVLIGEDLYGLSIDEISERITLLTGEISRLERELTKKEEERQAADNIFGSKS